jgi:hypothetical protein
MKDRIKLSVLIITLFLINPLIQAQNWNEVIKVVASDRATSAYFGYSVAIDGNYAIVGAQVDDIDIGGNTLLNAGSAYILKKNAQGNWSEIQKITASDLEANARFGYSVSISGNIIVIGALFEGKNESGALPLIKSGAAYIFSKNLAGNWIETQKIVASDRSNNSFFGNSVSNSNLTIVIGARGENKDLNGGASITDAGASYVFEKDQNNNWIQVKKLIAFDRGLPDLFGYCVSVFGDKIVIGSPKNSYNESGLNFIKYSGAVYIYERNNSGVWSFSNKLVPIQRYSKSNFGLSVSIDQNTILVGAPDYGTYGASFIFEFNSSSTWQEIQKITLGSPYYDFGISTAIQNDYLIIGSLGDYGSFIGGTLFGEGHIYRKMPNGVWSKVQTVTQSDGVTPVFFGNSVSISGRNILIGAYKENKGNNGAPSLTSSGAVYFFENDPCANLALNTSPNTLLCDNAVIVSATAAATGGTAPYFYNWSNVSSNSTISNLSNGTYTVTLTDANGCTLTDQVVISDADFRDIEIKLIREDCGRTNLDPLNGKLNYETLATANNYRVRINGGAFVDHVANTGNDDNFNLGEVKTSTLKFELGTTYDMEMAALINGQWTAYGPVCQITTMLHSAIDLKFIGGDCGREGADPTNTRLFFERRFDATHYQVKIENSSLGYSQTNTIGAGANSINLVHYSGIEYNTTYNMSIAVEIDGAWTPFGTPCLVTTADILSRVNLTLRDEYCDKTNLDPDNGRFDYWTRNGVSTPDLDHKVKLTGPGLPLGTAPNTYEEVHRGSKGYINTFHFNGVQFNSTYTAEVAVLVDGVWSNYGDPCTISTASMADVVKPKLDCISCGQTNINPVSTSTQVYYVRRRDASDHRVKVSGPNVNLIDHSIGTTGGFPLSQITGLQYNETYTFEIAALIDGVWSPYGPVCTMSMRADPSLTPPSPSSSARIRNTNTIDALQSEETMKSKSTSLQVFPNPSHLERINVNYQKIAIENEVKLGVFDMQGKPIFQKTYLSDDKILKTELNSNSELKPGIYLIRIQEGSELFSEKLIIQ